jgi:hypothetical protein
MVFSQQVNIVPENVFLKLFAEKSRLPLFPSVSVPSECAVSGFCSFNANELLDGSSTPGVHQPELPDRSAPGVHPAPECRPSSSP